MDPNQPTFSGLLVYRQLSHRFSLLYPDGWRPVDVAPDLGGGAVFHPDPADPTTFLLVQSRRHHTAISATDLDVLHEGFLEGLRQLSDVQVESEAATATGPLVDLEARHTFREAGETRKRWTRVLYQDTVQINLIAQGSSESAFQYWLPMFTTVMRTVKFADWWADMTGKSWVRTVVKPKRRRKRANGERAAH
jgi:hypothetical protein